MSLSAQIDHLVLACADLTQGAEFIERQFGVTPQPGGRHELMGTHNRLLRLGPRSYLELIALDPQAPPPARVRWFGLDTPAVQARAARQPFLLTWVASCSDIDFAVHRAPQLGAVVAATRGSLSWRITVRDDGALQFDGALPSLIQWSGATHPCDVLEDLGCTLVQLSLSHPRRAELRERLQALGLAEAVVLEAGAISLRATVRAPRGDVDLLG